MARRFWSRLLARSPHVGTGMTQFFLRQKGERVMPSVSSPTRAHPPSPQLPPDVLRLIEILARIEARRQARLRAEVTHAA